MACLSHLLEKPEPQDHFLQLHGGDVALLAENVARYLSEGIKRGEGALVIATSQHRVAFLLELEKLGVDTELARSESSLLLLDAQRTLGEFMIEGQPDWDRFQRVVTAAIAKVQAAGRTGLRAYG